MSEHITQDEMMTTEAAEKWITENPERKWDEERHTLYGEGNLFVRAATLPEAVTSFIRHNNGNLT